MMCFIIFSDANQAAGIFIDTVNDSRTDYAVDCRKVFTVIQNCIYKPTGLRDHYPIVLNGVEYQYFKTWEITRNDSVTTHETEGGKQEDVTTRRGRLGIGVTVVCLQPLLAGLVALAKLDEFQAKIYDVETDDYVTILVRVAPSSMRYGLKEKSANLETVNGVYSVSFRLEEF